MVVVACAWQALVGYLVKLGAFEEAPPLDLFLAVRSLRKLVVEPGEEVRCCFPPLALFIVPTSPVYYTHFHLAIEGI